LVCPTPIHPSARKEPGQIDRAHRQFFPPETDSGAICLRHFRPNSSQRRKSHGRSLINRTALNGSPRECRNLRNSPASQHKLKPKKRKREDGKEKAEKGRQKTENGRHKTEKGRQKTENGKQKRENRKQKTEKGRQKT
jgi:hypothetical protein